MNVPAQTPRPGPRPPPLFFAITAVSALCLAAGVIGLFVPELVPPLADRVVAFSFIGVGVVLTLGGEPDHWRRQRAENAPLKRAWRPNEAK